MKVSPQAVGVSHATIIVNLLSGSFSLAVHVTLPTVALTGFFLLLCFFFLNTTDDAKVAREVSESVTLCFVSSGCNAG